MISLIALYDQRSDKLECNQRRKSKVLSLVFHAKQTDANPERDNTILSISRAVKRTKSEQVSPWSSLTVKVDTSHQKDTFFEFQIGNGSERELPSLV